MPGLTDNRLYGDTPWKKEENVPPVDESVDEIDNSMRKQMIQYDAMHMQPYDRVAGFDVRPGFYEINGATAIPTGVNFTISTNQGTSVSLLLFKRTEKEPYAVLKFPENYRVGKVWSMIVFGLEIEDFEYAYSIDGPYDFKEGLIFDKSKIILDPYARAVTGQSIWGVKNDMVYKARVVKDNFDWGKSKRKPLPMEDLIIYEMHVRGFTMAQSADVGDNNHGTFEGVMDKIPYLKSLGVTAVEFMPIFEFDEYLGHRDFFGRELIDYWGYNTVCFFAPNTSYTSTLEYNHEGTTLKKLIKELHNNGIEVILDVVFNHTAEGNEQGPTFSFKGIDNNIFYMLTPDGYYYNFSGCGNTLNCNHPIVQQFIRNCLRYWVINFHIDGFRFDLATILGRNEDGSPMQNPPLLQSLAFDPILGNTKLIAEAWDAGGLYQVGSFPSWNRWAEWNGRYRDDMRSFLKGDSDKAYAAAQRIMGSPDLYDPAYRGHNASVNFLNCHDGFTLHDMYTYSEKHNEENNWGNTDGANDNLSWNCGVEGETTDPGIKTLRRKMCRNAATTLLMSRGTPMFYMGDEFGNSQGGNNNSYCQDNYISWLNWDDYKRNKGFFEFVQFVIRFRKKHLCIRTKCDQAFGFPEMSMHGTRPFDVNFTADDHYVGVMFAGINQKTEKEEAVYVAVNSYWGDLTITLPKLPDGSDAVWHKVMDTYLENPVMKNMPEVHNTIRIGDRSVMVFLAE
jgi:isoamylase